LGIDGIARGLFQRHNYDLSSWSALGVNKVFFSDLLEFF
jgi:hypothetical protein